MLKKIFYLLGIFAILLCVLVFLNRGTILPKAATLYYGVLGTFAVLSFLCARASRATQANILLMAVSVGIAVYTIELVLPDQQPEDEWITLKRQFGSAAMNMPWPVRGHSPAAGLAPLAGIANIETAFCKEGDGDWMHFRSDEHGFNNVPGRHDPSVDAVLVGDSFTQGYCVPQEQSIAGHLEKMGVKTLSLGLGGAGTFTRLAEYREYGEPIRPRRVYWIHVVYTLPRIGYEQPLRAYLDPKFTQHLRDRQGEVDQFLNAYSAAHLPFYKRSWLLRRLMLFRIRFFAARVFVRDKGRLIEPTDFPEQLRTLEQSLTLVRDSLKAWNGQLVVVNLVTPNFNSDTDAEYFKDQEPLRQITKKLGLELIDLSDDVLKHPDVMSLFPNRKPGHFGSNGYELVARRIAESVRAPGRKGAKGSK